MEVSGGKIFSKDLQANFSGSMELVGYNALEFILSVSGLVDYIQW